MPTSTNAFINKILSRADLLFTFGLFATVLLLIVPIPPFLLDILLAFNIAMSLIVLLAIIYTKDAPEFSGFPTVLLTLTLFRLALNISSTRLILSTGSAGDIISSFGHIVIGSNYIVGAVVFIILVVINFVVITKGAGRIAEVSARFTLDAMPGKQMAIDAELNAGIIDEATAKARRLYIQKEADFYGAMDGASKFVRGDAVAGILITLVNVIGGFAIGVFQMDLSLVESLEKFTILSIGDGLVSQIPALIISIGAGLLVTRATESSNLGNQVLGQLFSYPRALGIASGMLFVFALLPGMPFFPFAVLATITGFLAYTLKTAEEVTSKEGANGASGATSNKGKGGKAGAKGSEGAAAAAAPAVGDDVRKLVDVDIFAIEIGHGLLNLAQAKTGGDLLTRVTGVRKNLARERGIIVPPISVRDNLELEPNEYRFMIRGKTVARGQLMPTRLLAMNVSASKTKLRGVATKEPVFKLDATWIDEVDKKNAELSGYTVVDPCSVMITHLAETLKNHAHLLLGRQEIQAQIDYVKQTQPALIAELLPDLVSIGVIQRVLQNLLRENLPVTNLPIILEGIADFAGTSKNPDDLSELVRKRLGIYFVPEFEYKPGFVKAITIDPRFEQWLTSKIHKSATDIGLGLDPATGRHMLEELNRRTAEMVQKSIPSVIVVSAELRLALRRFLEPTFPRLTVLAFSELPSATEIENTGIIPMPEHLLNAPIGSPTVLRPAA
jgi:flagellar biosynthesis protein FlhA